MILLTDFRREELVHRLDPATGVWFPPVPVGEGASQSTVGWADIRPVGLWRRQQVQCAVFADARTIWCRIADVCVDLDDSSISVSRRTMLPFLKRFRVRQGKALLVNFWYWWADLHEWPDDDVLDIFLFVPAHLGHASQRGEFVRLWSLMSQGMTATEANRVMEAENKQRERGAAEQGHEPDKRRR